MLFQRHKLSEKQLQLLIQQLADLLKAGLNLYQALELLKIHTKNWHSLLSKLQEQITNGLSLSTAMSEHPQYFSTHSLNLIRCGETSGQLAEIMAQIAQYQIVKLNFKRSCWRSCAYPGFVLLSSLSVALAIMLWIIPLFATLFSDNQQSLPFLTQLLIQLSVKLPDYGLFILGTLTAGIYCWRLIYRAFFPLRWRISELSTQLIVLNRFIQLVQLNQWLPLMANYLQAGMHLLAALQASSTAFSHLHYQARYQYLLKNLAAGHELAYALKATQLFPQYLLSWIVVGERSGNLAAIFQEAARYYQQELQRKLQALTQFIEPLSLLLISALIGMLIIALYLPIFKMGDIL